MDIKTYTCLPIFLEKKKGREKGRGGRKEERGDILSCIQLAYFFLSSTFFLRGGKRKKKKKGKGERKRGEGYLNLILLFVHSYTEGRGGERGGGERRGEGGEGFKGGREGRTTQRELLFFSLLCLPCGSICFQGRETKEEERGKRGGRGKKGGKNGETM